MKIGIDARFYGLLGKGLGRYTEKLIEHLEEIDLENDYVIFLRRENFHEYRPRHPRFRKVLAHYPWYGLKEQLFFPWLLWRHRLDIMHFPHFNVPVLYPGKFVVTIHDLILLHYPTLRNSTRSRFFYLLKFSAYRFIIAQALRRARSVLTVSEFTKRDLAREYPRLQNVHVTPEAADAYCHFLPPRETSLLLKRLGLLLTGREGHDILQPYILYVGNAYPHKNLEQLIEIAPLFPEHLFVLVGKSDFFYERLRRLAERKEVPNIVFTGFLTDRELGALYRQARLYVFPSLYEGFGLPPLEAMNYGLPVLSSDRASLPEVLGDAACYFNPEDRDDLHRKLERLLESADERERLRIRGMERIRRFSWQALADTTRAVYAAGGRRKTQKNYVRGASQNE